MSSQPNAEIENLYRDNLSKLSSLKLPVLKVVARALSIAQSGRKADVQDRVRKYIQIGRDMNNVPRLKAISQIINDAAFGQVIQSYESLYTHFGGYNTVNNNNGRGMLNSSQGSSGSRAEKPWIFFRETPFFILKKMVSPEAGFCARAPDGRGSSRMNFVLNESDYHLLKTSKHHKLYLLCGVYDRLKAKTTDSVIEFPQPLEIHFNGVQLRDNVKGLKNKPGTAKPANLTPYISQSGAINELNLVYAFSKVDYLYFCYLIEQVSAERVLQKVLTNPHVPKQSTLSEFNQNEQDEDDLQEMSSRLSLKCPLSFTRMKYPVKSIYCTHLGCFDALSFLYMQEQTPTWECPLCYRKVRVKELAMNDYVLDILKNTQESIESVDIELDGSWKPVIEDDDGDDDSDVEQKPIKQATPVVHQISEPQASPAKRPSNFTNAPVVISLDSDDEDADFSLITDSTKTAPTAPSAPSAPTVPSAPLAQQAPSNANTAAPRTSTPQATTGAPQQAQPQQNHQVQSNQAAYAQYNAQHQGQNTVQHTQHPTQPLTLKQVQQQTEHSMQRPVQHQAPPQVQHQAPPQVQHQAHQVTPSSNTDQIRLQQQASHTQRQQSQPQGQPQGHLQRRDSHSGTYSQTQNRVQPPSNPQNPGHGTLESRNPPRVEYFPNHGNASQTVNSPNQQFAQTVPNHASNQPRPSNQSNQQHNHHIQSNPYPHPQPTHETHRPVTPQVVSPSSVQNPPNAPAASSSRVLPNPANHQHHENIQPNQSRQSEQTTTRPQLSATSNQQTGNSNIQSTHSTTTTGQYEPRLPSLFQVENQQQGNINPPATTTYEEERREIEKLKQMMYEKLPPITNMFNSNSSSNNGAPVTSATGPSLQNQDPSSRRTVSHSNITSAQSSLKEKLDAHPHASLFRSNTVNLPTAGQANAMSRIQELQRNIQRSVSGSNGSTTTSQPTQTVQHQQPNPPKQLAAPDIAGSSLFGNLQRKTSSTSSTSTPSPSVARQPPVPPSHKIAPVQPNVPDWRNSTIRVNSSTESSPVQHDAILDFTTNSPPEDISITGNSTDQNTGTTSSSNDQIILPELPSPTHDPLKGPPQVRNPPQLPKPPILPMTTGTTTAAQPQSNILNISADISALKRPNLNLNVPGLSTSGVDGRKRHLSGGGADDTVSKKHATQSEDRPDDSDDDDIPLGHLRR